MKKIIVHIGDSKCGSTAIQNSLVSNRSALEKNHALIYRTGDWTNHVPLTHLVGHDSGLEPQQAERAAQKIVDDVRKGLDQNGTHIFSAENFLIVGPYKFAQILEKIGFGDVELDVICYLREPQEHYLSAVQERIKISKHFKPPNRSRRNVYASLSRWQTHKSVKSMTLKKFSRDLLVGNDITSDFSEELKRMTGAKDIALHSVRANESLSAEQMVAIQWLRATKLPDNDGRSHAQAQALIRFFNKINTSRLLGTKPKLKPKVNDKVRGVNAIEFQNIHADFGIDFGLQGTTPIKPGGRGAKTPQPTDPVPVTNILNEVDLDLAEDLKRIVDATYDSVANGQRPKWNVPKRHRVGGLLHKLGLSGPSDRLTQAMEAKYNLDVETYKAAYAEYRFELKGLI